MYIAHKTNLKVGSLIEQFGDAHIYKEESHDLVSEILIDCKEFEQEDLTMVYNPTANHFKASDFSIVGKISKPLTKIRPNLL